MELKDDIDKYLKQKEQAYKTQQANRATFNGKCSLYKCIRKSNI